MSVLPAIPVTVQLRRQIEWIRKVAHRDDAHVKLGENPYEKVVAAPPRPWIPNDPARVLTLREACEIKHDPGDGRSVIRMFYCVQEPPPGVYDPPPRLVRHLSVSFSVPGVVGQGDVQLAAPKIVEHLMPTVDAYFPMHDGVAATATVERARKVVRLDDAQQARAVHDRTPIVFHFLLDHETLRVPQLVQAAPSMTDGEGNPI